MLARGCAQSTGPGSGEEALSLGCQQASSPLCDSVSSVHQSSRRPPLGSPSPPPGAGAGAGVPMWVKMRCGLQARSDVMCYSELCFGGRLGRAEHEAGELQAPSSPVRF